MDKFAEALMFPKVNDSNHGTKIQKDEMIANSDADPLILFSCVALQVY